MLFIFDAEDVQLASTPAYRITRSEKEKDEDEDEEGDDDDDDDDDDDEEEEEEEEEEENGPCSRCVASGNYEFSWFLGDQPTTKVVKPCLFLLRPKRRCLAVVITTNDYYDYYDEDEDNDGDNDDNDDNEKKRTVVDDSTLPTMTAAYPLLVFHP
ncbi:hypothetical protein V1478_011794 [Vespula squamosa]|uniref:Uncharacterized protein n=1 Tax=Vespula squamosa TaxID=30214 RepID=A0ABD2ABD1_VESSQ